MEDVVLSTAHVAPLMRAPHWNAIIAETYFPLHLTFRDAAGFQGWLTRKPIGALSLSRLVTDPLRYERRPRHISDCVEEEYLVTIPYRSPVEFRQLGRDVRCDPGGFILERGDEPYRFSYADSNDLLVLKVSKPLLVERLHDPDRFCAQVFNARANIGRLFAQMASQVMQTGPVSEQAAKLLGRQLVELLSLALDGQGDVKSGTSSAVRAAHLNRAKGFVRRNLMNGNLSPEKVALACGISKRYLHELFSDENGTVSQFIREQRLIACREILEAPGTLTIAEVAYRYGFSDQAQFSRLFKAAFGKTPSGFRAQHRSGSTPGTAA